MNTKRGELGVGIFVTAALSLLLLFIFLLGGMEGLFSSTAIVEVDFTDVQNLQEGDPAFLFGQKAGKVAWIRRLPFESQKPAVVRVGVRLPAAAVAYLRANTVVKVDKNLTGNISVLLQEPAPLGPPLAPGGRLQGEAPSSIADAIQEGHQLVLDARHLISIASEVVEAVRENGDLPRLLSSVKELVNRLDGEVSTMSPKFQQVLETMQGLVQENRLDLRHAVANLKETSGLAKTLAERISETPQALQGSLEELRNAGREVVSLIRDNRVQMDSIVDDLQRTMASASNLSAEVKRRPWRLLYRPTEEELHAAELFDAAWAYNLGATELNRSLRELSSQLEGEASHPGASAELEEAKRQVAQSLRRHREAEERFWAKLGAKE